MNKIGNIVYEENLVNHIKVDYINYFNQNFSSFKSSSINKNLPALYVGWSFIKKINNINSNIENLSILEKEIIKDKLYWEFSFNENKSQHIIGIDLFVNNVPYYFFLNKYKYNIIDPIFNSIYNINDLLNCLPKNFQSIYNYKNQIIYLLNKNEIFSIDLLMYKYFGFNLKNIIDLLSNKSNYYFLDFEGNEYMKYYKVFPNFDFLKRCMVVLLSK